MISNIDLSGRYGLISINTKGTAVAIYNDEQIEEKLDAPRLDFSNETETESLSENEILEQKVGAIHEFFEEVGMIATTLFNPVKDDLEEIIIMGSSPMKYQFAEGRYLGNLHNIASVVNAGELEKHPLSSHVDDDKTLTEQLRQ